ncbi:MAG: HEAT repeat domain-containing protein [Acidobacteria bacterium]|nr:HEAT repeat domain-containing protein [Acidobacteriota bacterium]
MVAATLAEVASSHELVALVEAASDPEPEVRAKVARALGRTAEPGAFEPLRRLAHDAVWYVRLQALGALAHIHLPEVHDVLLYGTADKDWRVRGKAATALYRFVNDPIYLLGRLQEELADRYAIDALIAVLEREGIIWQAINSLRSPMVLVRESSRELVVELILAGKFAAVLYALEMHPDRSIRQEVLSLVNEHSGLSILAPLGDLLESRTLDGETRRGIEELFARWKG